MNQNRPKRIPRIPYYDFLRIAATLAVILLHTATSKLGTVPLSSSEWNAMMFYDGLTRWSVPLFFMLSGALFLSADKPFSAVMKKNAPRILTAFLFWSFLYTLLSRPADWKAFLSAWIPGYYHLWFCWAILGLYLLLPVLRPIVKNPDALVWYLVLFGAFASLAPFLSSVLWLTFPRLQGILTSVLGKMDLRFPTGYAGCFVLGYVLSREKLSRRGTAILYALGLLSAVATPLSGILLSRSRGMEISNFYPYLMPNVIVTAAALFVFAKRRLNRPSKLLRTLSDASFGAYLVHVMLLEQADLRLGIHPLLLTPWVSIPLLAALLAALSLAVGALIRKIPAAGKYIA